MVILGGGFAGVYAALHLEKIFSRHEEIEILLLNDENFLLFTPMLPEVPSSSIEAKHIVSPLRAFFRKVKFQNREVHSMDLPKRILVASHCPACSLHEIGFDHLVLALGSTTNFYGLPGVAENALPMKTLADAMGLRNHVIGVFEHADLQDDAIVRKAMLTFVVVGGGFAGAETVAELHDFARTARRYYSHIRDEEVRVILVHSGPRILPELGEDLAHYALEKLRRRGIEVLLNTRVSSAGAASVDLANGQRIATETLVWAAGVSPSPLLAKLPCRRNKRGAVIVNAYLEVPEHAGVWALGDCAEIPNPETGRSYPPTAQHAIRQGRVVAENIAASLGVGSKKQFLYRPLGMLADLGRRSAVAEILGFKFSGFFAWWLWRTIYLLKLPGLERKVRVAMDWTLDLFFPRDIVLLKFFKKRTASEMPLGQQQAEAETKRGPSYTQEVGRPGNVIESKGVPPRCEFELDKLILQMDQVISSDVSVMDDVVAKITGLIERAGCADDLEKIDLALREALANAILHGNRSDPAKAVRVCVAVQEGCGILIVVKDAGSGFDPSRVPSPLVGQNLLAGHGRGIFLINQLMDDVGFVFRTGTEIHMRRGPSPKEENGT